MELEEINKAVHEELDVPQAIHLIRELQAMITQDLDKAEAVKEKTGKYSIAPLYRVRQTLVILEKLGLRYRKLSIELEKELKQEKQNGK